MDKDSSSPEAVDGILNHLLEIESKASVLLDDAQEEADRRISESEKQCRGNFDKQYQKEVDVQDAAYEEEVAIVRKNYSSQLEEYHAGFKNIDTDINRFSNQMEEFLVKDN